MFYSFTDAEKTFEFKEHLELTTFYKDDYSGTLRNSYVKYGKVIKYYLFPFFGVIIFG